MISIDTIFMNLKNSKTSDSHTIILNLGHKTNLKKSDKYVALSSLSSYCAQTNIKRSTKNKFKILAPTWKMNCYLSMDYILYQILKINLSTLSYNMKQ